MIYQQETTLNIPNRRTQTTRDLNSIEIHDQLSTCLTRAHAQKERKWQVYFWTRLSCQLAQTPDSLIRGTPAAFAIVFVLLGTAFPPLCPGTGFLSRWESVPRCVFVPVSAACENSHTFPNLLIPAGGLERVRRVERVVASRYIHACALPCSCGLKPVFPKTTFTWISQPSPSTLTTC